MLSDLVLLVVIVTELLAIYKKGAIILYVLCHFCQSSATSSSSWNVMKWTNGMEMERSLFVLEGLTSSKLAGLAHDRNIALLERDG